MTALVSLFELSRDATGSVRTPFRKSFARGFVQPSTLAGARGNGRNSTDPHCGMAGDNGCAHNERGCRNGRTQSMMFRGLSSYAGIMSLALLVGACGGGGG